MKLWRIALACVLCTAALLTGCGSSAPEAQPPAGKIPVVASFDAMKEFTEAVGGDRVAVTTLIPAGTEPHDFQPTPHNLKSLLHARLFICNGLGMEPWADEVTAAVGNESLITVDASRGVDAIPADSRRERFDPHCWLSLEAAQTEVQNIADTLAGADPDHADYYQKNAAAYKEELRSLLEEYRAKFQSVPGRHFVTGHAAFAYLCRDYGLIQDSVAPVFAGGEPGPQQLARLADLCREYGVKTIFVEEMVSPRVSETLAREVGADAETIYTMESAEEGASYTDRMRDNLEKIYRSLQ